MGTIKKISLTKIFRRFLICLLGGLCLCVLIPFSVLLAASSEGLITLADNDERQTQALVPILTAAPDISQIQLPVGTKFLRLDKNYAYIDTNMNEGEKEKALEFARTGFMDTERGTQFIFVTREEEYIVLQYHIGSQYLDTRLDRFLPPPEILMISVMIISSLCMCTYLTVHFSKKLGKELKPILEATKEVEEQNLDFEIGHSRILEFENVIQSLDQMRNSLKKSLEQQWRSEMSQREQIASLAHDLKTPLTVIQGNIDLLEETALDEEQKNYTEYAMSGAEQMKEYIKILIDISRATAGYQMKKEEISFQQFWEHILSQGEWVCREKQVKLKPVRGYIPEKISGDSMLLERAVMNLISNASDYAPAGSEVLLSADREGEYLRILVTDSGPGFYKEAMEHGRDKFYMGDKSRSSRLHYGMGLYITDRIVQLHKGRLTLRNSRRTGGGEAVIKIPL